MIKNNFLHANPEVPLDFTTLKIMDEYMDAIKKNHADLLPDIVKGILGIQSNNVQGALAFVKDNPKFYQHELRDLRSLECMISSNFNNIRRYLKKNVAPHVVDI